MGSVVLLRWCTTTARVGPRWAAQTRCSPGLARFACTAADHSVGGCSRVGVLPPVPRVVSEYFAGALPARSFEFSACACDRLVTRGGCLARFLNAGSDAA
mmetsp:Transcript_30117/g.77661  ORF Transcript_30117/g.77661 Transcript_30117/m.77661 type:complete len:100 (+) Transcript_30117:3280-3579(+)